SKFGKKVGGDIIQGKKTYLYLRALDSNAYEFKYDPNDHSIIYAVGAFGCYRTADGGDSWSQIVSATTWDLDFRPSSSDTIYMLSEQPDSLRAIFLRSIDAGQSWDTITAGWYRPEDLQHASAGGGKIAVTPADPNRVYVGLIGASKGGDNGWIGVYKSTDSGTSFTLPQGQTGGPYDTYGDPEGVWSVSSYKSGYHQGFYNYDLEVSHTDPEKLWVGTVLLSESTDGGRRWCQINGGSCKRITQHADVQDIDVYGDEIWTASDGGIDFSPDEYLTNESRKRGIIGSDFWGFDTGWNTDILVGGKYHNGNTAWYESYPEGITHYVGGVEEFTGYVHPQIDRKAYFNQYWSNNRMNTMLIPRAIGANTESQQWATVIPNEGYPGESSGYVFHPVYSDRIFIGKDSTIQRSDDGGLTWRVLEGFDFGRGYVTEIEISRSNPDVMYAGYKIANTFWTNQDIYRSDDGGENWTKVTRPPFSQYYTGKRVAISLNPWDEDDIIIGMWFEFNGKKVYRSQDGGQSWNNITPSMIDDQKIADVYYQAGVDSSSIYVSTNEGVYRYNTESGTWHDFSSGLPTIAKGMRLRPFYKKSKLRMSSEGRGIWEAPLAGDFRLQALPMTLSDTLRCSRDTVFLDSYSIVNQTDVSWLWEITPMPRYVSDATSRAPKVLLDDGISYDVTLTVTDAAGVTNSRTISDMLYMKSECEVDSVAGRALQPWASGQYATAAGIGYSGAAYSVSMWVKPSADHPSTAFLWSNGGEGDLVGVNFANAGDDLRIHHAGRRSTWAIHTDLKAPADAWTHVVLVSDPEAEELRLYANGVPFTYSSNEIGDYDFETLLIGVQRNWSSRWFKGRIDEVKLYNRALSTDEVRMMRHMIADPSADQSLIGYWQCNERTGQIIDRAGIAHATSFAARTSSTAPVAVGKSELRSFLTHGSYRSESTGIEATFFENDHPNGDVVFNLLYDLPHDGVDDTEGLGSYWIVNNYGDVVDSFSLSLNFNAATGEAIPPRIYNRSNAVQSSWS
ncbi:MAG: LamG-like jellyroll fold domain-containing protein, partial [Bacteroidota bacterium]